MLTTVTKTVRFDAAHLLSGDEGKCGNLHGHAYRVEVSVTGETAAARDMVVDFRVLKRKLDEAILTPLDHAFLYNGNSEVESEIAAVLRKHNLRTVPFAGRTTAENLAAWIFERLRPGLPELSRVRVWETPDNVASCEKGNPSYGQGNLI